MTEIKTEKYIAKIHPGKMTDEERKEAIINAAKKFYESVQPDLVGSHHCCTCYEPSSVFACGA